MGQGGVCCQRHFKARDSAASMLHSRWSSRQQQRQPQPSQQQRQPPGAAHAAHAIALRVPGEGVKVLRCCNAASLRAVRVLPSCRACRRRCGVRRLLSATCCVRRRTHPSQRHTSRQPTGGPTSRFITPMQLLPPGGQPRHRQRQVGAQRVLQAHRCCCCCHECTNACA